jgi:hypothetical protein
MLLSGLKRYHLELMLLSGITCYYLGLHVIIWDAMLSSGANVIIWDKMVSSGANVIMVSSGANVIIWCYHVMLSSEMITHPFFIFPENFTHSTETNKPIEMHDMETIPGKCCLKIRSFVALSLCQHLFLIMPVSRRTIGNNTQEIIPNTREVRRKDCVAFHI